MRVKEREGEIFNTEFERRGAEHTEKSKEKLGGAM